MIPKTIISASRRTDIPAFHGDRFMERTREGSVLIHNPKNEKPTIVSLHSGDVRFIVFWSKDYAPFLGHLETLKAQGFHFYFHFTINGYPRFLEKKTPSSSSAIKTAKLLAKRFSPEHVLWRFDPIIFSSATPPAVVEHTFSRIAAALKGVTRRCYFSFIDGYSKTLWALHRINHSSGTQFHLPETTSPQRSFFQNSGSISFDISPQDQFQFAQRLAKIAHANDITMHTCCDDFLVRRPGRDVQTIAKAHCVDHDLIASITGSSPPAQLLPTRKHCGCYQSVDIGSYNTCSHGCSYCYACDSRKPKSSSILSSPSEHRCKTSTSPQLGLPGLY